MKPVCQDRTIRPSSHCFPLMLPYIDRSTGSHLKPDSWIDRIASRRILVCSVCQHRPYRRARRPLPDPHEMHITPNEEAGPATCIPGTLLPCKLLLCQARYRKMTSWIHGESAPCPALAKLVATQSQGVQTEPIATQSQGVQTEPTPGTWAV